MRDRERDQLPCQVDKRVHLASSGPLEPSACTVRVQEPRQRLSSFVLKLGRAMVKASACPGNVQTAPQLKMSASFAVL